MKRTIDLVVDFKNKIYNTIFLKQMDTTEIKVKLLDNNIVVDLMSQTVDIIFTKPDYTIVQQLASDIDIANGIATIPLLADCVRKYGKAKMEIEVKNSDGEIISSFYIPVQIEKTSKENIQSDNTPNYIEEMEKAVKELEVQAQEMLEQYENLTAAVETVLANVTNRGHIYGIKRKITDLSGNINTSPTWTKIYDNAGLVAEAQIGDTTTARNDYDNIYPWNSIITINYDTTNNKVNAHYGDDNFAFDGSNGEVLTRYPKMWVKRLFPVQEDDGYYEYRMIADFEVQDFIQIESWMEGRYELSIDADNVAHSISGVYPKYNANIKQFLQYAKNLGESYCIEDWHKFVLDTLYLVEYANNNSQTALGRGVTEWSEKKALIAEENVNRIIVDSVSAFPIGRSICIGTSAAWNSAIAADRTITSIETYADDEVTGYAIYFDGEPVNIAVGNDIWGSAQKTGDCDSLGMKSGCLVNDGRHSCIYRGKEQPLGNIFKFIIGLNIQDYQTYVTYDSSQYTPDIFDENYHKLSYANPNEEEGYIKIMGFDKENPLIALPTTLGAVSTTGYCDYCYSKNSGNRVALVGGYFHYGARAGLFYWGFNASSSGSDWSVGARLLKLPV